MSWKPASFRRNEGTPTFDLWCPYCHEPAGTFDRRLKPFMPPPQVCAECERTFIIPVAVSRGGLR